MRFDFTPLFRSTVGFDTLSRMIDSALEDSEAPSYPPYNIEKTGENAYRVTMAVAGFGEEDLSVTVNENSLLISGKTKEDGNGKSYLYRGIAGRAFERRFQLADHIQVKGARLEKGLLHVDLIREVPEALRPRRIEITNGKVIESRAA